MNPEKKYLPALIAALAAAILPHTLQMAPWITAWCAAMWAYLLLCMRTGWPRPGRRVRILLSVAGIAGLVATYGIGFGSDAFVGLLAVMAALKPFEISTHRDRMITVFIAYFIIISSLLRSETFAITLYMFFSVLLTTAALVRINDPLGTYKTSARRAGLVMAQALPLMILLFLLFPRLEGSLVGFSQTNLGQTGFSDQLSPGSVANLVQNNDPAFRAQFDGPVVPPEQRYWRGIVFSRFDGRAWYSADRIPELNQSIQGGEAVEYTISLEPHNQQWIFALDLPAKAPSRRTTLKRDFTVVSRRSITRKRRYQMRSYTRYNTASVDYGVKYALKLPQKTNPRARDLASDLAENSTGFGEIVENALSFLRDNNFVYTLQPPLLGQDPVDDFLFESRKGYCEHYASAFAFLMRAAGVPARIVGGYLGGQVNPWAQYLIIRQSDAHVWVEVWYPEKGWTRVDPTLEVAPERLDQGAEGSLKPGELGGNFARKYLRPITSFIDQVRLGWDALSLQWEAWFSAYSKQQQQALLKALGIDTQSWKGPFLMLLAAAAGAAGLFLLYARLHKRAAGMKTAPEARYYEKFCAKMARAGIVRPQHMGPLEFAEYVAQKRPDLEKPVHDITRLYIALRYRQTAGQNTRKQFIAKVRAFAPAKDKQPT